MGGECRRECSTAEHSCKAVLNEQRDELAEMLFKHHRAQLADDGRKADPKASLTDDKFTSRVCKKLTRMCPGKKVPEGWVYKRDEQWMPIIDEEGWRMKKMQNMMNKQAKAQGSQPVQ